MKKVLDDLCDYRRCWLSLCNSMYDVSLILEDKKLLPNERKVHDELVADIQHDIVQKFTTEFVTVITLTLGYGNTGVDGSK